MVPILVLLTFLGSMAAFGVAHHFKLRRAGGKLLGDEAQRPGKARFWAPEHTWVQSNGRGLEVGFDSFTARVLSPVEQVALPEVGRLVRRGEKLFSLRVGQRQADFVSPVEGVVGEVNEGVAEETAPWHDRWICRIETGRKVDEMDLMDSGEARGWMSRELERFVRILHRSPGPHPVALPDGGLPAEGALHDADDETWRRFVRAFLEPAGELDEKEER